MIRVAIVDDQALIRAGFKALVDSEDDMEVVAEATNGIEAVDAAFSHQPDVMLMDIRMPRMDGLAATKRICEDDRLANTRILVLTTFDLDEYVYGALRAGASGFMLKDTDPDQLLHAIRVVAEGNALLDPVITGRLITQFAGRPDPDTGPEDLSVLTEREREILAGVAGGLSNQELADKFFISPLTAKTHVSRILTKLDARDRAQLVVIAYESGLVRPGT